MRVATIGDDGRIYDADGEAGGRRSRPLPVQASPVAKAATSKPMITNGTRRASPVLNDDLAPYRAMPVTSQVPPPTPAFVAGLGQAPKFGLPARGRPQTNPDFLNRILVPSGRRRVRSRGLGQETSRTEAVDVRKKTPYEVARSRAVPASSFSWNPNEGDPKTQIFPGRYVVSDQFPGMLLRIGFRPAFTGTEQAVNLLVLTGDKAGQYIQDVPVASLGTFLVVPEEYRFELDYSYVMPTPSFGTKNSDVEASVLWANAMLQSAAYAMDYLVSSTVPAEFAKDIVKIRAKAYTAVMLAVEGIQAAGSAFDFDRLGRRGFRILLKVGHEVFRHAWQMFSLAIDIGNDPTQAKINEFHRVQTDAIDSTPYWAGLMARAYLITGQYILGKMILNENGYQSAISMSSIAAGAFKEKRAEFIKNLIGRPAADGTIIDQVAAERLTDMGAKFYQDKANEIARLNDEYTATFRSRVYTSDFKAGDLDIAYGFYDAQIQGNTKDVKKALDLLRKSRRTAIITVPEEGISGLGATPPTPPPRGVQRPATIEVGKRLEFANSLTNTFLRMYGEELKNPANVGRIARELKEKIIDPLETLAADLNVPRLSRPGAEDPLGVKYARVAALLAEVDKANAALRVDRNDVNAQQALHRATIEADQVKASFDPVDFVREGVGRALQTAVDALTKLETSRLYEDRITAGKELMDAVAVGPATIEVDAAGRPTGQIEAFATTLDDPQLVARGLEARSRPFQYLYKLYEDFSSMENEGARFSTYQILSLIHLRGETIGVTTQEFAKWLTDVKVKELRDAIAGASLLTRGKLNSRIDELKNVVIPTLRKGVKVTGETESAAAALVDMENRLRIGRAKGLASIPTNEADGVTLEEYRSTFEQRLKTVNDITAELSDKGEFDKDGKRIKAGSLLNQITTKGATQSAVRDVLDKYIAAKSKFTGIAEGLKSYATGDKVKAVKEGKVEVAELEAKLKAADEAWKEMDEAIRGLHRLELGELVSVASSKFAVWTHKFHAFFNQHIQRWMDLGKVGWAVRSVLGLFLLPALLTPLVLPLYLVLGIPMELLPLPFTLRILKGLAGFLPDSGVNEEPGPGHDAGRGSGLKLFVLLMGISIIFFGKQFFPAVTTFFSSIRGSVTQVTSLFKKKKGAKRPVGRPKKEDGEPRGPGRPKMIKPAAVEGIPPQLLSYIFGR